MLIIVPKCQRVFVLAACLIIILFTSILILIWFYLLKAAFVMHQVLK